MLYEVITYLKTWCWSTVWLRRLLSWNLQLLSTFLYRITSYNVCYTKLLRMKEQIIRFAKAGDLIGFRSVISDELACSTTKVIQDTVLCYLPGETLEAFVITSYSIHYTKLYERFLWPIRLSTAQGLRISRICSLLCANVLHVENQRKSSRMNLTGRTNAANAAVK